MALMTRDEYVESLRVMDKRVFIMGQEVENLVDHPLVRPSLNACAMTYELAQLPEGAGLARATSNLTGNTVNRFTHLHQDAADLVAKVKMQRRLGQMTGCCFQRCVGMDAINALDSVTYEMDEALGTGYHGAFRQYLQYLQEHDLVADGAMTDPKGDRRLSPSQQADPDLFVRIVDRKPDGIVVRGAKLHQTGALNAHEIIVMPTRALSEQGGLMEAEDVARAMIRGIEQRRPVIIPGFDGKLTWFLKRHVPGLVDLVVGRIISKAARDSTEQ